MPIGRSVVVFTGINEVRRAVLVPEEEDVGLSTSGRDTNTEAESATVSDGHSGDRDGDDVTFIIQPAPGVAQSTDLDAQFTPTLASIAKAEMQQRRRLLGARADEPQYFQVREKKSKMHNRTQHWVVVVRTSMQKSHAHETANAHL